MAGGIITSADAIFTLTVSNLYNAPITLQNFAADRAWETAEQEMAETEMSIDGYLNAAWVPNPVEQTISLSAGSDSVIVFETIIMAQNTARTVYRLGAEITLTGPGRKYTLTNGVLRSASVMPSAGRTLETRRFQVRWERVTPAGI